MISFLIRIVGWGMLLLAAFCIHIVHAAEKPTSIVFLTWKPNQPAAWNRLIKRFHEKHPGIRVKRQVCPHSSTEYHAIITQRLKNRDSSVDVFLMDVVWPPEFANAGWALDLTSRFPEQEQQKFLNGPISAGVYRGKIYECPATWRQVFSITEGPAEKISLSTPRHLVQDDRPGGCHISG